jgi:hypothetical protein
MLLRRWVGRALRWSDWGCLARRGVDRACWAVDLLAAHLPAAAGVARINAAFTPLKNGATRELRSR